VNSIAEILELTPKANEALKRADLSLRAAWMIRGLRFMTHWADECNVQRVFHLIEDTQRSDMLIMKDLDKAVAEGRITKEERMLIDREFSKVRGDYIGITIHKLQEKCGCRFRSPRG